VRLDLPEGWRSAPASAPFALERAGQEQIVRFEVIADRLENRAAGRSVHHLPTAEKKQLPAGGHGPPIGAAGHEHVPVAAEDLLRRTCQRFHPLPGAAQPLVPRSANLASGRKGPYGCNAMELLTLLSYRVAIAHSVKWNQDRRTATDLARAGQALATDQKIKTSGLAYLMLPRNSFPA